MDLNGRYLSRIWQRLQIASPDSWALRIKKKRNRPARFLREHSDAWNNFAHPFVGGVAHI